MCPPVDLKAQPHLSVRTDGLITTWYNGRMCALLFLILGILFSGPVFAENTRYEIVADYEDEEHEIVGDERITFFNQSAKPVTALYLFLYPNLYRGKHPDLDVSFYRKAYPVAFNPGGVEIISIQDMAQQTLPFFPVRYERSIIIKVVPEKPVLPQHTFQFSVRFRTKIPEKWGPFSHYKNLTVLQGGWHPYLANFEKGEWRFHDSPQKSDYHIQLRLKKDLLLIGSSPPSVQSIQGDWQTLRMEGKDLALFSLSIARDLSHYETKIGSIDVSYHALSKNKSYAQQVMRLTEVALQFYIKRFGSPPPTLLQLTSAGLYQDLSTPGTKMLFLNNRIFKIFPILKRFHEASLAYGLYRLLWREKRPEEVWWVIEGLAKREAEAFMHHRYGKVFNLEEWLRPISFIPVIDQILYSPTLPLRQVYFRESVTPIVSEDVRFFNNPPSENPNIFSKLRVLLGDKMMDRVILAYLAQEDESAASFRTVLEKTSVQDLNWLIDQWLSARLKLDFEIVDIKTEEIDGIHETAIQVRKNGEGIEPLQVRVQRADGTEMPLIWDGVGKTHRFNLKTRSPIESVELDPKKLSNDPNRLNNRQPHRWKVLLDQLSLNYDFQTQFLGYNVGLLFQRLYDSKNWVRVTFSQNDSSGLVHLGYSHVLKKNHILSTALTQEKIKEDLEFGQPGAEAGFFSLGYTYLSSQSPLLTESLRRLTTTFPSLSVGLTYNQQFTSQVYDNSLLLKIDLRRIVAFSNYREIGARMFIGQSIGRLFEQSRFYLGGSNAMRGYTPLVFEGQNMSLFSVEYRFPIFYETDINFLSLMHTHTWQGVVFADTGMVDDAHNVFKVDQFKSDVGAGLRFFVDLFGVYPAILRADLAVPIASPREDEQKIHYYLNMGQSF